MRTFPLCACAALGLALAAGSIHAQQYVAEPSYLPQPAANRYQIEPVGYRDRYQPGENLPSPSDRAPAPPAEAAPPMASDPPSAYQQAMQDNWGDGAVCSDGSCGGGCGACPTWYAYGGGVFMSRGHRHGYATSFDQNTGVELITTCDVDMGWAGGFEATLGRTFGNGCWALEGTYWGLFPGTNEASVYGANDIATNYDFSTLDYDDGVFSGPISGWFNNASHHRLQTFNEIHSVEVNVLGSTWGAGMQGCGQCGSGYGGFNPCSRWGGSWLAGIRYFQFDDGFLFSSDEFDDGFDGDPNEVHYEVRMKNRLVGFQFGGGLTYRVNPCWTFYGLGKAGVYGNNIDQVQQVYGANGYALINSGAWAGETLHVHSQATELAMLAQFDLGARWQINCNWSLKFGYRVVGVSGVALSFDQAPADFSNVDDIANIDPNGSLLLHGGYAGLEFCW